MKRPPRPPPERGPANTLTTDLLNDRKQISILEDSFGVTQMAGALEHHVTDKDTLLRYIDAAAALRSTTPTLRNDNSSRSHAICRIRFENPQLPTAKDGLLYLIDLAGSEAARDKVAHDTSRMKEAREINSSLSVLKDCIRGRALADADSFLGKTNKKPAYVPFRQSTLTKTLKHVFDPASTRSCKTVVVACVNPCLADLGASKNTMRYAEMLRVPMPKAKEVAYSPGMPATWNNDQLRDWIQRNVSPPLPFFQTLPSSYQPLTLLCPVVRRPPGHPAHPRAARKRPAAAAPTRPRVRHALPQDHRRLGRAGAGLPRQVLAAAHRLAAQRRQAARGQDACGLPARAARLQRRPGARRVRHPLHRPHPPGHGGQLEPAGRVQVVYGE